MINLYREDPTGLVAVSQKRLPTEDQLQKWIADSPRLIGQNILVLGREVGTAFGGRIDVLGLDGDGNLVVIECKRDRTPREIVAQILDYASWAHDLSADDIVQICREKLDRNLDAAFQERFGFPLPEDLNSKQHLLIVASEFDPSSKRIVEFLARVHGLSINTVFFTTFEHHGELLMATDWLMDQEEVVQRAEHRAEVSWGGYWYVNVCEDPYRSWEDMRNYGFVAAGGGRAYSAALDRLPDRAPIFAYQRQTGYVGYGIVSASSMRINDFEVNGKPILQQPLVQPNFKHDADDPQLCEYLVRVNWKKTFPLKEAKTFRGVFANQNIVCKLRNQTTMSFLLKEFGLNE